MDHVVPQQAAEELKSDWSNFLLGCINCNSRKSIHNTSRSGYIWPDEDDTFSAFTYQSGGRASVAEGMEPDERCKAEKLFELVGLGELGTNTDRRRHKRRLAWDKAISCREIVNSEVERKLAVEVALGTGFFSVWMAVFRSDEEMRHKLVKAFPGTRR